MLQFIHRDAGVSLLAFGPSSRHRTPFVLYDGEGQRDLDLDADGLERVLAQRHGIAVKSEALRGIAGLAEERALSRWMRERIAEQGSSTRHP